MTSARLIARAAVLALLVTPLGIVGSSAASAATSGYLPMSAPTATKYANCAALNRVYKWGVGRSGAVDSTKGKKRATRFTVNNDVYNANRRLDRDGDGIACEKV